MNRKAYTEGDYYLSVMNVKDSPALALHYALLLKWECKGELIHSQWKLASKLALELNDYSSILIIMDNVDNDVPGIRVRVGVEWNADGALQLHSQQWLRARESVRQ